MITDDIRSVYHGTKWSLIVRGLLGLAIGIVIFARPLESVAALALVIAIWALVDGIVNISRSFQLRGIAPHWWVLLLAGIVSVVFGIAAFAYYPALSLAFAVLWSAWWLLSGGAIAIYLALRERKAHLSWGWTMAGGVLGVVVGVFALMYPGATLAALMGLLATFGIVGGIVMLVAAGKMQRFERKVEREVEDRPAKAA